MEVQHLELRIHGGENFLKSRQRRDPPSPLFKTFQAGATLRQAQGRLLREAPTHRIIAT